MDSSLIGHFQDNFNIIIQNTQPADIEKIMEYNQVEKEKSRELIWEHVISSLTHKRSQSTIINPELINEFTLTALNKTREFISNKDATFAQLSYNSNWEEFHSSVYSNRRASELKVAFFCGPEPINDLKHILSRGIRLENIWGFEINREYYDHAKIKLIEERLYINLFQGNLNDFIKVNPQKFDIIYLDFTNSLVSKKSSPLALINSLFDSSLITELTTIIINTCYPDKEKNHIDFLSRYFEFKKWIHRDIYDSRQGDKFHESFTIHGIYGDSVLKKIEAHFEECYSEFSSSIVDLFSNIISPLNRITKLPTLHKKLFNIENIEKVIRRFEKVDFSKYDSDEEGGYDLITNPDNYGYWHFIQNIINNGEALANFFSTKIRNEKFTPFDLVKFYSILHSIEEGYFDAFSKEILDTVVNIQANTIEHQAGMKGVCLFCDLPMTHLWYSLLIGKYGYPNHINYNNHKRYSYVAKTRKMCLDIYTVDQCRSLYDYMPSFEFLPNFFKNIHQQLIIRCYIDRIYKTQFYYNDTFYSWGHLLCCGDSKNSKITNIQNRKLIKT